MIESGFKSRAGYNGVCTVIIKDTLHELIKIGKLQTFHFIAILEYILVCRGKISLAGPFFWN